MLKISAFYLDKQNNFIPKKYYEVYHVPYGQFFLHPTDAVLCRNSPSIYDTGAESVKNCWEVHCEQHMKQF